jgi:hypothetical protein
MLTKDDDEPRQPQGFRGQASLYAKYPDRPFMS